MSALRRWRALMLFAALSSVLGGCVAAPVAQLASQAIASGGPGAATQVAQAPQSGNAAQAAHGLGMMLQQTLGAATR